MKNEIDRAKLDLSLLTPDAPKLQVERIITRLARLTPAQRADFMAERLDAQAEFRRELEMVEHQLSVLGRANVTHRVNERKAMDHL